MKRPVLETRRQVMSAVVCDYPGGRDCAAARLGLPLKKFDNHLYESAGSRPLSDEQIRMLEHEAGTHHFAWYVCSLYGGMFVPTTEPEQLDNVELYSQAVKTAARRGAVDQYISHALADGVIQPDEALKIINALQHYMASRHAEVLATISLHSAPGSDAS